MDRFVRDFHRTRVEQIELASLKRRPAVLPSFLLTSPDGCAGRVTPRSSDQLMFSKIPAAPIPPPTHMLTIP